MNKDTRLYQYPGDLKVGQKVTTDFIEKDKDVIRTITNIEKNSGYGSGYVASADSGEACECCDRKFSQEILSMDACWFIPIEEEDK